MRLSIAIPIYNFAEFIVETLDSIVLQARADEVEIVVVDGASTDATPRVMAEYQARHPAVRYERLPAKGGIDRDMATAFSLTTGDYCWLFSGDDIMRPGALARALQEIDSGCDIYLSQHMEFLSNGRGWVEWPVLTGDKAQTFELSDPAERRRYFESAANTEAFFSFMGGMINKRASWDRIAFNEDFDRSVDEMCAVFSASRRRTGIQQLHDDTRFQPGYPCQRCGLFTGDRLQHGQRCLVIDQTVLQIDSQRIPSLVRHELGADTARNRQPAIDGCLPLRPGLFDIIISHDVVHLLG